jgi:phosphopantothenoylcysteine decarboxylase/phosphopantothenoylcysteine decarboxylase/phosphopantothenate--cysteine ligase
MSDILLGVCGSIAAYKACEIANQLTKDGHAVHVLMTKSATELVSPITFQTLTKLKVHVKMFDEIIYEDVRHISLADNCDLCVIAPASANVIGKLANGICDDMLTTVVTAIYQKPIIICPAMNTAMYENPAVKRNVARLIDDGYTIIEPKEGRLACGTVGKGALADVDKILSGIYNILEKKEVGES